MINNVAIIALIGGAGMLAKNQYDVEKIRSKKLITKAELFAVANVVKLRYPRVILISNEIIAGLCFTEAGTYLNGKAYFNNAAYRNGGGIDISLGICQLITPTATGLKTKYKDLPALVNYDTSMRVYKEFYDPYVSLAYGLTLLADNYDNLKRNKSASPLNEAIKAYNTGMGNRNSAAGNTYLNKVVANITKTSTMA